MIYHILADLMLISHALFVAFVVGGQVLVVVGGLSHWRWVKNFGFRMTHALAIGIVILQAWLGLICPLTTWEMLLRAKAGGPTYRETFMAHWLHELLYFTAPAWVFTLVYTLFGAAVLATWFLVPPRRAGKKARPAA